MDAAHEITLLLHRMRDGDADARERLFPLLYDELRGVAQRFMARERAAHTLQPTALVNEAYVKITGAAEPGGPGYVDRDHFLNVAAQAMRRVLVDHARARRTEKRGEGRETAPLDHPVAELEKSITDLVALDEALNDLEAIDAPLARMVELRFFAGLDTTETARVLGTSKRTVERGWTTARAWLRARLDPVA